MLKPQPDSAGMYQWSVTLLACTVAARQAAATAASRILIGFTSITPGVWVTRLCGRTPYKSLTESAAHVGQQRFRGVDAAAHGGFEGGGKLLVDVIAGKVDHGRQPRPARPRPARGAGVRRALLRDDERPRAPGQGWRKAAQLRVRRAGEVLVGQRHVRPAGADHHREHLREVAARGDVGPV